MQTVEFRALVARQLALMSGSDVAAIDAGLADPLGQGVAAQSLSNNTLQVRPSARSLLPIEHQPARHGEQNS